MLYYSRRTNRFFVLSPRVRPCLQTRTFAFYGGIAFISLHSLLYHTHSIIARPITQNLQFVHISEWCSVWMCFQILISVRRVLKLIIPPRFFVARVSPPPPGIFVSCSRSGLNFASRAERAPLRNSRKRGIIPASNALCRQNALVGGRPPDPPESGKNRSYAIKNRYEKQYLKLNNYFIVIV